MRMLLPRTMQAVPFSGPFLGWKIYQLNQNVATGVTILFDHNTLLLANIVKGWVILVNSRIIGGPLYRQFRHSEGSSRGLSAFNSWGLSAFDSCDLSAFLCEFDIIKAN